MVFPQTKGQMEATGARKGRFIVLEGGEGSGKSTQLARLQEHLEKEGYPVLATREPGGTPLGEALRTILKHAQYPVSPRSELLLFCAARAQLVEEQIQPALQAGYWVLADRFTASTFVYQGIARGLGPDWATTINRFATGGLEPDLTILLDLPPQIALERIQARGGGLDRLEALGLDFHTRVREAYLELAKAQAQRFLVLPAQSSPESLAQRLWAGVQARFF